MNKTKVGILYICTGRYSVFWKNFLESSNRYLFTDPDIEKNYFVFTDDTSIQSSDRVHIYYKEPEGFPADSFKRFEMFLSIKKDLLNMDYVFFLNANMLFIDFVGKEILPTSIPSGLTGVLHPGYYNSKKNELPYERNPKSMAYIPFIKGIRYHYFMGGFNGGKTQEFLELCEVCRNNILEDENKGIMACFHDESHINAYFLDKPILVLPAVYGFPEDQPYPFSPKVVILNKAKHYGDYFNKEYANPFILPSPLDKPNFINSVDGFFRNLFKK